MAGENAWLEVRPACAVSPNDAHKVQAGVAGLADMIAIPARQLGVGIQRVAADDLRD